MTDLAVAFTTTNQKKEAESLAKSMVDQKLAACVNIVGNINSIYEWDGQIHNDSEFLLIIKVPKDNIAALKKFIEKNHSYEVPEFIAVEVIDGLPNYLKWAADVGCI